MGFEIPSDSEGLMEEISSFESTELEGLIKNCSECPEMVGSRGVRVKFVKEVSIMVGGGGLGGNGGGAS